MTFGRLIATAWTLYRHNFRLFAGTAGMVTALQALELLYAPKAWLVPLVFVGLWPVLVGVMSVAIASAYEGRTLPSVSAVFEAIGRKAFIFLVIVNLIIVLINAIGLVLLIIPGIYLWVRFQFAPQALVLERSGLSDAFSRSSDLVRGSWWRVFGIDVAVFGAATIVNLLAFLLLAGLADLLHFGAAGGAVLLLIGISIVWALMDPLVFGIQLLLYYDLSRRQQQVNVLQPYLPR